MDTNELYRTIGILGNGGFGVVTLVENRITKQLFALKKRLPMRLEVDHTRLISESVVRCYDIWSDGSWTYELLEYAAGGTLRDIIPAQGFAAKAAIYCATMVLEGISFLHANGIIHNDITPQNALVFVDGHVKLTDFGMAQHVSSPAAVTIKQRMGGTPGYIAPEVMTRGEHSFGSDWWSFGALLHELYFGSLPPSLLIRPQEQLHCNTSTNDDLKLCDLISRLLVTDPITRIDEASIWRHPCFRDHPKAMCPFRVGCEPRILLQEYHRDELDQICSKFNINKPPLQPIAAQ
jgi:serine/threonine protein kinase